MRVLTGAGDNKFMFEESLSLSLSSFCCFTAGDIYLAGKGLPLSYGSNTNAWLGDDREYRRVRKMVYGIRYHAGGSTPSPTTSDFDMDEGTKTRLDSASGEGDDVK